MDIKDNNQSASKLDSKKRQKKKKRIEKKLKEIQQNSSKQMQQQLQQQQQQFQQQNIICSEQPATENGNQQQQLQQHQQQLQQRNIICSEQPATGIVSHLHLNGRYQGVVCSLKKSIGFIERGDVVGKNFFHISEAIWIDDKIKLGDNVEFTIQIRNGKEVACSIIKLPSGTVVFEDINPEPLYGQVLKPLECGSNVAKLNTEPLNGRLRYRGRDRLEVEIPFGDKDQKGEYTLRHEDAVKFNIAVDRRNKLERATNIELQDESFVTSGEQNSSQQQQQLQQHENISQDSASSKETLDLDFGYGSEGEAVLTAQSGGKFMRQMSEQPRSTSSSNRKTRTYPPKETSPVADSKPKPPQRSKVQVATLEVHNVKKAINRYGTLPKGARIGAYLESLRQSGMTGEPPEGVDLEQGNKEEDSPKSGHVSLLRQAVNHNRKIQNKQEGKKLTSPSPKDPREARERERERERVERERKREKERERDCERERDRERERERENRERENRNRGRPGGKKSKRVDEDEFVDPGPPARTPLPQRLNVVPDPPPPSRPLPLPPKEKQRKQATPPVSSQHQQEYRTSRKSHSNSDDLIKAIAEDKKKKEVKSKNKKKKEKMVDIPPKPDIYYKPTPSTSITPTVAKLCRLANIERCLKSSLVLYNEKSTKEENVQSDMCRCKSCIARSKLNNKKVNFMLNTEYISNEANRFKPKYIEFMEGNDQSEEKRKSKEKRKRNEKKEKRGKEKKRKEVKDANQFLPGHGLLSALDGHSSLSSAGTPPSQLRQTTQILFSSSASTPSPTASALTSTAATVTTTRDTTALSSSTSSSSMSSHFPSSSDGSSQTTSTAVTMFMSSVNSKVVSSIAQRNSQAQHQQQGSGSPSVMSKLPGTRAATLPIISVATSSSSTCGNTMTTSTTINVGSHPSNHSPLIATTVQQTNVTSSSSSSSQAAESSQSMVAHGSMQPMMTDLLEPPIGVMEIEPIPTPPMFSSPSPMLPICGAHHSAPQPTHGIHQAHLTPPAVASSSPNMLTSIGHDLSDLQDDDVPKESVDNSDSERGLPPAASLKEVALGAPSFSEIDTNGMDGLVDEIDMSWLNEHLDWMGSEFDKECTKMGIEFN